ncbi:MAG: cytochrome c [Bacteroidota bacterium]
MRYFILLLFFVIHFKAFSQDITWYKDIEPLIQNKCASCHHEGGGAPFSLINYEDVSKRATFIKEVVTSRYMPPWRPDKNYTHFSNDRSLKQEEIDLIAKWIDNKKPKGKPIKETTKPPTFFTQTKYTRAPDLTLTTATSFEIKGDNAERFVIFKIPFDLPEGGNVEAAEFYSSNKKVIHHANYEVHEIADTAVDIISTAPYINLTDDDRSKYDQYKPYRKTITYYGGWIPGTTYEYYPKEFGWVMPKRGVILITVHFAPTAVKEECIAGINLFFKSTPVTRPVKVISFGSGGVGQKQITPDFYINANEKKTFTLEMTNPGSDLSVMYVWPHMHYIGKEFTAFIVKPGGDTVKLVHIPEWDFRWQEIYRFPKFVKVPKGSVMHIVGTYDNTASNPANPFNPPQTIMSVGDMRSTDEMMTLLMIYLPYKAGDEDISLE